MLYIFTFYMLLLQTDTLYAIYFIFCILQARARGARLLGSDFFQGSLPASPAESLTVGSVAQVVTVGTLTGHPSVVPAEATHFVRLTRSHADPSTLHSCLCIWAPTQVSRTAVGAMDGQLRAAKDTKKSVSRAVKDRG